MIGNTTNETTGERFDSQKYEKGLEDHWKEAGLVLIALIYCITNFTK